MAERVGIEPTSARSRTDNGFEDRGDHQAPFTLREFFGTHAARVRQSAAYNRLIDCNTSLGFGNSPVARLEYTSLSSAVTSNTPPELGTSSKDAMRCFSFSSWSAKLTACGS